MSSFIFTSSFLPSFLPSLPLPLPLPQVLLSASKGLNDDCLARYLSFDTSSLHKERNRRPGKAIGAKKCVSFELP
ncbi:MAG: hypothetical protein J3Q66DRAFT_341680 [Benniella sp.]|nr:MAG: hypothetical protein J3Q66DRAFT_341680 [Benniella sp.]